jgi:hypothetical protein
MPDKNADLRDLYNALAPDPDALTAEEVAAELEGAEDEAAELRALIGERAQTLARDLRKNGFAAPPVLKDIAETLADTTTLPRDETLARTRAAARFADMERTKPVPRDYELLEAARKGKGELTQKDRDLLDAEAEELRKELDAERDAEK